MSQSGSELERALLGAALVDPQQLPQLREAAEFFAWPNRGIAYALIQLADEGIEPDIVSLRHKLNGDLDAVGGPQYLVDLMTGVPKGRHAPHYVRQLRDLRARESSVTALRGALEAYQQGDPPERVRELLEAAEAGLYDGAVRALDPLDLAEVFDATEETIPWVLEGWLAAGESVLIGGQAGIGKSVLILDLALALASGETEFLGMQVDQPQRVLYLDEENGTPLVRHRLRRMLRGREHGNVSAGKLPVSLHVKPGINLDDPAGLYAFRRLVEESEPDWIFLDSLVRFHNREENDNAAMASFFRNRIEPLRREHGFGLVILHHVAKPSTFLHRDRLHDMRGASDLVNQADCVWSYTRDGAERKLAVCKSRWTTDGEELLIRLAETGDSATLTAEAPDSSVETFIGIQLVMAADRGVLRPDLIDNYADETGKSPDAAKQAIGRGLAKMRGRGAIRQEKDGRANRIWLADSHGSQA